MQETDKTPNEKDTDDVSISFYTRNKHLWNDMREDCCNAKEKIHFTQYMMFADHIGCTFLDVFEDKLDDDVKVDLLFDPIGSLRIKDTDHIKKLKKKGATVRYYNDLNWFTFFMPSRWFPRNHSKLMYIDDDITYVGGMCVADFMLDWHDIHARIEGDLSESKKVELVHSNQYKSRKDRREVYYKLIDRIDSAQEYIEIITPYCVPPYGLIKAWERAIRRGVQVRLILSSETDNPIADYTARYYLKKLLKIGMDIQLYDEAVLHAKLLIVDGKWATFGSANMDYLSMCRNKEVNIFVYDQDEIHKLQEIFDNYMKSAHPATYDDWKDLPIRKKIMGRIGRVIRRYL